MSLIGPQSERERCLVYVVDDQRDIGEIIGMGLETSGYRVEIFSDPVLALSAFTAAAEKPNLLISDFNMPGMNGMELLQRCKRLVPELRTISLSGTLNADILSGYEIKPDVCLAKPVRLADFLCTVRDVLASAETVNG